MKNLSILVLCSLLVLGLHSYGQDEGGVSIGKGNTPANSKSILEMVSESKGLLIPRMSTEQRVAIFASEDQTATGLLVFDNSLNSFFYWNGTSWKDLSPDNKSITSMVLDNSKYLTIKESSNSFSVDLSSLNNAVKTFNGVPMYPGTNNQLGYDSVNKAFYIYDINKWVLLNSGSADNQTLGLVGTKLVIENSNTIDLLPILGKTPSASTNPSASNSSKGDTFFNTTNNQFYFFNGTSWNIVNQGIVSVSPFTSLNNLIFAGDNNDNFVFGDDQLGLGSIKRTIGAQAVYSKMFYNADKAAIRAGGNIGTLYGIGSPLEDVNIGLFSAAFGFNNIAKGDYAVVSGGSRNLASGYGSNVSGGLQNLAKSRYGSVGGGVENTVTGLGATIPGGVGNTAQSWGEVVIGTYSDSVATVSSRTSAVSTDRLFVIGNGTGSGITPRSNSLVMLKNGSTTVSGNWSGPAFTSPSDIRLKENIKTLTEVIEKLKEVRGVEFDWKILADNPMKNSGHDLGIIAQELQKVYPGLVHEREDGYLTVDYAKLSAVLLQAFKEQQIQIDLMNDRINTIEKRLNK